MDTVLGKPSFDDLANRFDLLCSLFFVERPRLVVVVAVIDRRKIPGTGEHYFGGKLHFVRDRLREVELVEIL